MDTTFNIDPDGTPHSKFVNDVMMRVLQDCPLPAGMVEQPDNMQLHGQIVLGTLAAINAGILANLLPDPDDETAILFVISQLATITLQEFGTLKDQMQARRNPQ